MSIAQPVSDLVNGAFNTAATLWTNKKNRESQEAMNAANIQAQKDINAQNLANQDYWNRVTMDREDTAWQRASSDIQKSGLSKALLTGGASATPLSTANMIAPHGDAYTGEKAASLSGNTVGGLAELGAAFGISNLISSIKDGINGKRSGGSVPGSVATVDTPNGSVEVSRVDGNRSNGNTSHFDTRDIPCTKFVATPNDVDNPNGYHVSLNVNSARVSSAANTTSSNVIGNELNVLKGVLSPDSKERLAKFIKLTQATADGNLEFKPGMTDKVGIFRSSDGTKLNYEHQVPSLLAPVCADLIQEGVVDNQAEAQMYIKNLVYTIETDNMAPSKETLHKMLGVPGFGWEKHKSHEFKYPKHYTTSGAAKYKAHD